MFSLLYPGICDHNFSQKWSKFNVPPFEKLNKRLLSFFHISLTLRVPHAYLSWLEIGKTRNISRVKSSVRAVRITLRFQGERISLSLPLLSSIGKMHNTL